MEPTENIQMNEWCDRPAGTVTASPTNSRQWGRAKFFFSFLQLPAIWETVNASLLVWAIGSKQRECFAVSVPAKHKVTGGGGSDEPNRRESDFERAFQWAGPDLSFPLQARRGVRMRGDLDGPPSAGTWLGPSDRQT